MKRITKAEAQSKEVAQPVANKNLFTFTSTEGNSVVIEAPSLKEAQAIFAKGNDKVVEKSETKGEVETPSKPKNDK